MVKIFTVMRRSVSFISYIVLALAVFSMTSAAVPHRIISLAPNLTEMLYAIGAGKHVIAVSRDSDYPAAAGKLPKVSAYPRLDVERIAHFHPDLIVVWYVGHESMQLQQLAHLGIPIFYSHIQTVPDIAKTLQVLGKITGHQQQADHVAQQFLRRYTGLKRHYAKHQPFSVMLQEANQPIYVATGHSIQSQLIQLCGGRNVFGHLSGNARPVSREQVLAQNPQVIVTMTPLNARQIWQRWSGLAAVEQYQLCTLPADLIARAGPRVLQGSAQLCRCLQA